MYKRTQIVTSKKNATLQMYTNVSATPNFDFPKTSNPLKTPAHQYTRGDWATDRKSQHIKYRSTEQCQASMLSIETIVGILSHMALALNVSVLAIAVQTAAMQIV